MDSYCVLLTHPPGPCRHGFDSFIVDQLMTALRAHGPELHPKCTPSALKKAKDGSITCETTTGDTLTGFDTILMAVGRKPVTEALQLQAAGVKVDKKGYILGC